MPLEYERLRSLGAISKATTTILGGLIKIMAVKILRMYFARIRVISPQNTVFALIFNLNSYPSKLPFLPSYCLIGS